MIALRVFNLSWIQGSDDDSLDLCAHGEVELIVNDTIFVSLDDGGLAVSTAALYLLRTLRLNHSEDESVCDGDFLFPQDSHYMITFPKSIFGFVNLCDTHHGADIEVRHIGENVKLRNNEGSEEIVSLGEWREAVIKFADNVEKLYQQSYKKIMPGEAKAVQAWEMFWKEWNERRNTV